MRKTYVALLLLVGAVALTANAAFAQVGEDNIGSKLMNAKIAHDMHSRAANLGVSSNQAINDTVYVGYSSQISASDPNNYWRVGAVGGGNPALNIAQPTPNGKPRPHQSGPSGSQTNTDGMWTWENPVHGDSLQGWWPIRVLHQNASGATLTDDNRPWWAVEFGNDANYVVNERRDGSGTSPGDRTFGVVGVWHSDPGLPGVIVKSSTDANPIAPAWSPLGGSKSAWMGLRAHGDATVIDPITKNAFNQDVLVYSGFTGSNPVTGNGTSKHFPGYGNQMDQMLYRDIDVTGTTTGITIGFKYQTQMSTDVNTAVKTRTGWFEGDPLNANPGAGNLISAEAGIPANSQAPADSFQVYVGQPVDASWTDSFGTLHGSVYDPLRRWFNEVLQSGNRLWLFSSTGITSGTQSISLTQGQVNAMKSGDNRVRLVFRVHTNGGFDDENVQITASTAYNSAYKGAAQVDDITVNKGAGAVVIGDFEGSTPANDIDNTKTAAQAWRSTGKPPAIYFHVHDLASLSSRYNDLCGGPNASTDICNLFGQVISMGNHDDNEATAALSSSPFESTEKNGQWGIISPTINLVAPGASSPNAQNITGDMAAATEDWYLYYEMYAGIFNVFSTGCLWRFGVQSYPALQSDGTRTWGEIRLPGFNLFNPDPQCFSDIEGAKANGMLATSNPSGIPDSMRIFIFKVQQCYRFGVADADCHKTDDLGLIDNTSLVMIDGVQQAMSIDIWHFLGDTFPFNESASLIGTAGFDTCAAYMKSGINIAQTTGNTSRIDIAGDSVVVNANGQGDQIRIDMIFRIKPGPGNYVVKGNVASGLRHVPSSAALHTATDFWGSYMANPGDKAAVLNTHTGAPSGWDPLMWNSARCDTSKLMYFPVLGAGLDATGGGQAGTWQSTYSDGITADAHLANLGIPRNRCFVVDTTLTTLTDPNVSCSGTPPAWVTTIPPSRTGWDGTTTTTEGTKIIPDGLFTPGTHIEYFFRREDLTGPSIGKTDFGPDTTVVTPQPLESSFDGHRWQEVSVLPDKWKDPAYGGTGNPCMLYIDWNDRRGDELTVLSVMDSIGATAPGARGNNNGWAAPGTSSPNLPANFVNKNACAGTSFDKYDVKASESLNTGTNSIGSRHSNQTTAGQIAFGKDAKNAPTDDMLNAYYKILLIMSGDLNSSILGPFKDRSANDVVALENFLLSSTSTAKHGIYAGGNGFVEDANAAGPASPQLDLVSGFLGADLNAVSGNTGYRIFASNGNPVADILPTLSGGIIGANNYIYGIRNGCTFTLDVLQAVTGTRTPNATVGVNYQNTGANGPYSAVVVNPGDVAGGHPWIDMVEGWDISVLTSRFDVFDYGRIQYYYQAFANVFGSICAVQGTPLLALDTPNTGSGSQYVDFVGNFSNNPLRSGAAVVRFGLAQSDRVEVDVYDVSGRMVRKLADRTFPAGEHTLTWDGVNDQGQIVARGVYFTQVKFVNRHFSDSKKLTVLK
jgi:FlgD Ig-like domain